KPGFCNDLAAAVRARAFPQWVNRNGLRLEHSGRTWLRELGTRIAQCGMPISWHPGFVCSRCESGRHRIGFHWYAGNTPSAGGHAPGLDVREMAEGFRPVTPERTLTGISVRVAQRKFRYRRPRVADLAVEVLVRTTIPPEGIEVPERFATVAAALRERGVFKS